jgi:hypothetical protein
MKVCLVIIAFLGAGSFAPAIASAETTPSKKPAGAMRTIDAITIEGDIAVPQVLFITSRDNRRYRDGTGKLYRKNTNELARSLNAPDRVCVAGASAHLKEE